MGRRHLRGPRKYHAPGKIVAVLVNLQELPKPLDTVEAMRIESALDAKGPGLCDSVLSLSQAAQRGGQEERSGQAAAHRGHLSRERSVRNPLENCGAMTTHFDYVFMIRDAMAPWQYTRAQFSDSIKWEWYLWYLRHGYGTFMNNNDDS